MLVAAARTGSTPPTGKQTAAQHIKGVCRVRSEGSSPNGSRVRTGR